MHLEDEIANDWKPRVKLLQYHCSKITAKLGGMEDLKEDNTAMKRRLAKLDVEKVEKDNARLKERVKELTETNGEWSQDAKCLRKELASAENKVFSVSNKNKLLEMKVDRLEKAEVRLGEEKAKRDHAMEVKKLQLEIARETRMSMFS